MPGTVLVSGAGIAGPTLAYWLHRHGFRVTVVERAAAVRSGGYPIDLRGVALDVVERMGLLDEVRAARTGTRRITFLDRRGRAVAHFEPEALAGTAADRAVELARGDLTTLLYERTRADVEYVFDDSIAAIDQQPDGVRVRFARGAERTVDLVVGADGLHSTVRRLVFGASEQFVENLGYHYAAFSVPDRGGLRREAVIRNTPARMAALYAVGDHPGATALLAFAGPPVAVDHRDVEGQRRLVAETFAGEGWEVPWLLERMREAEDFYFDGVSRVRMSAWSEHRVALLGDAAHAPSLLSGQGSSLAVVGAYLLASELATGDPAVALPAWERALRPFVERNQRLAAGGGSTLIPATRAGVLKRNLALRLMPLLVRFGAADHSTADAAEGITLPAEG